MTDSIRDDGNSFDGPNDSDVARDDVTTSDTGDASKKAYTTPLIKSADNLPPQCSF